MKLNKNYRIESDSVGATLIYEDSRMRLKDGKEVDYVYTDKWYFINMEQALNKFLDLSITDTKDAKDCIKKIDEIRDIIKKVVYLQK
jgi:phosphoserine aminotransferase